MFFDECQQSPSDIQNMILKLYGKCFILLLSNLACLQQERMLLEIEKPDNQYASHVHLLKITQRKIKQTIMLQRDSIRTNSEPQFLLCSGIRGVFVKKKKKKAKEEKTKQKE